MVPVGVVGPAGGEVITLGPARIRILEDGRTTGRRLGVAEITLAPHSPGPPQHRHARHDEGFFVVSGTATFTVGEQEHQAAAGTFVMVPPGAPHSFANHDAQPLVMINTFTPDLYVQYFRDLRDTLVAGQPLDDETVSNVMSRYHTVAATQYADETEA